ncbi:peptide ABC transporter permease [Pediococcus damnosus LMG 28219]|nr:peptide ABC transporter permease [Pediococcus damnosus LMG 28219]PIO82057.1 peptide ABC transporter permease [Pediococcus damnosus]PIO86228.1 peptide ABC transporter permease [Pediococcus damnosus]PJE50284.1 peptide ABC transporter permease [Pediococcus damnosus]
MMSKSTRGILYASIGAICWGISGPIAQILFANYHMKLTWLIGSKMLFGGILLLVFGMLQKKQRPKLFAIWHDKKAIIQLLIFTIFGMTAMQAVYYKAVAVGNAATATILQFLSPVFIVVFTIIRYKRVPRRGDVWAIVAALVGTYLLITGGNPTSLTISPAALFWGVVTGVAAAAYVLLPEKILNQYGSLTVSSWSMLVGGVLFMFIQPAWRDVPHFDAKGWAGYLFIVIFGSVIAYFIYLASLAYISATATGLLDAFEPLSATIVSVVFLNLKFGVMETIGTILILSTVFILAIANRHSS